MYLFKLLLLLLFIFTIIFILLILFYIFYKNVFGLYLGVIEELVFKDL